jgi:methyl-accepting chemotaxis protein
MLDVEEDNELIVEGRPLKSALAKLIVGAITGANSVLNEAAMDVEINATKLSDLFNSLTSSADVQTDRLAELVGSISTIKFEGKEIDLIQLPNILQDSLAEVTDRIMVLSKQGVSLIYALDDILEEIGDLGVCINEIESINRQTRLLSLNAQIESGRAGEAALGFQVVSTEMHNLSKRIDALSERMRTSIGAVTKNIQEVIGSIRDEYQQMSEIGAMDMTKQLDVKEHLEILLKAVVSRNSDIKNVLDDSASASAHISNEIAEVVTAMQFQDRLNQRCEAVVTALDTVAIFIGEDPAAIINESTCNNVSNKIVDNIRLHDVKREFKRELLGVVDDDAYDEPSQQEIELF